MKSVSLIILLSLVLTNPAIGTELKIGMEAPTVTLKGELGGKTDGSSWTSESMKGYVTSVFYVDPDERSKNEPLEAAYKKEQFPFDQHHSIAIINMAATWLPNGILANKLEQKQKDFPQTTYVKDFKKVIVDAWGLADDSVNLVVFDKQGKVLILKKAPVAESEFAELMRTIREALKQ